MRENDANKLSKKTFNNFLEKNMLLIQQSYIYNHKLVFVTKNSICHKIFLSITKF